MGPNVVFAMVLARDLNSVRLDGIVIRPSNNGEADVLTTAQDKGIKGADSGKLYQYCSSLKIPLLCDHIRSKPIEKHFQGRGAHFDSDFRVISSAPVVRFWIKSRSALITEGSSGSASKLDVSSHPVEGLLRVE